MTSPTPSPPGDVSCRTTGYTIQQLQRMRLPTANLTRGLPHTLAELQSPSASIPWESYLVFLRNSYEGLCLNQIVELCTSYPRSRYLGPLLSAAGFCLHPARYFALLAEPESGVIRQLFRCLDTQFSRAGEREVLIEERIRPGYASPPDIFWECQAIGFGALTTNFGLSPSTVTWERASCGAIFRIQLPRRRPVRYALSWFASFFRREAEEDMQNVLAQAHERSLRLEREIAERKQCEFALQESERRLEQVVVNLPGVLYQFILSPAGLGRVSYVSDRITEYMGYNPEEITRDGWNPFEMVHPDQQKEVIRRMRISVETLGDWLFEGQVRHADGTCIWLRTRATPTRMPTGDIVWNGVAFDVTEQKRAEEQLQVRDNLLQKLSEQVPGVIFQYQQWPDGRSCFPYASKGIREIYEVTPNEVRESAETVFRRLHPEDFDAVAASIRHSQETMEIWSCRYRVCLPERGIRWLDGHSVPERMADGSTLWHGYIRDVTERRQVEEALRLKETAIATSINAIAIADMSGRLTWVNRSFLQLWGYDHDNEILGRPPQDFCEQPERATEAIQNLLEGGGWVGELRGIRRDGSSFDAQVSANMILDERGQPTNLSASFTDITDRKQADAEVLQSRDSAQRALTELRIESARAEKFYRLCELAGQGIGIARLDGTLTYLNPAFRRLLEIPGDADLAGHAFWEFVPSQDHSFLANTVLPATRETGSWSGAFSLLTRTGRRVPIINTVFLLRDLDGVVAGYSNIATDITELKQSEQALRESETRYRMLIETSSDAIFLMDITGRIRSANPAAARMHGYTMDELLTMRMQDLDLPDSAAELPDRMNRLRNGESLTFEVAHRRKNGTTFPLEVIASAVEIGGEFLVLSFDRDISERKSAELREAAHMLRLKQLAELSLTLSGEPGLVFERVVSMIGEIFSVPVVCFSEIAGDKLMFRAVYVDGQVTANAGSCPLDVTPCATVKVSRDVRVIDSVAERFPQASFLSQHNAYSYCGFPSLDNEENVVAITCLLDDKPREFTEEDRHILRIIGQRLAAEVERGVTLAERRRSEAALQENKERLRIFIENAPAGVAMLDRELRYISCSRRWLSDYGLSDQNLVGRSHYEVFPEISDRWKEIHRRCLTGISERCEEDRFERADGTVDFLRWEVQPWTNAAGEVGGLVFFTESITERVRAEERVRASLREKESMLTEIHHRVKNNLQVISSLLSLQSISVTHPAASAVLAESQNRVRAMALVHETLYRSKDLAQVDLSRYLEELCGYLLRTYGIDSSRIRVELNVAPVQVSLDKTIPCGLIVNEIVSNSLKYAFPGTRAGRVNVVLHAEADGEIAMVLADDGVGLPADFDIARNQSLGLQLVSILTQQIGGHLTVDRNDGTRFEIRFTP